MLKSGINLTFSLISVENHPKILFLDMNPLVNSDINSNEIISTVLNSDSNNPENFQENPCAFIYRCNWSMFLVCMLFQ